MSHVIPTIFATSKKEFNERFEKILHISKNIQIDFMDGKFVKAKSISPKQVPSLKKYKKNFEAHLMVKSPEKYLSTLKKKGFKKVIIHIESLNPETLAKAKKLNLKLFLALNPETPVESLIIFLPKIRGVLFMGVHPGREGQNFIPEVYSKIKQLKKISPSKKIQVDGGINFN